MTIQLTSTRQRVKLTSTRAGATLTSTRPRVALTADRQGRQGDDGDPGQGVPTGGTSGQVLTKDSGTDYDTSWQDASGGASDLDDLTDVTITSAATGDLLRYNGSAWVDYPDSNYAAASHTHAYQNATVAVYGAAVGVTGNQTVPTGTSTVLVLGALSGELTMPGSAASNGQRVLIVNQSGGDLVVNAAGSDTFPLSASTEVSLATGDAVVFYPDPFGVGYWLPGPASGPAYDVPAWFGQGVPGRSVVQIHPSTLVPSWREIPQQPPLAPTVATPTTKLLRCDFAATGPSFSALDGAWSSNDPPDSLPDGFDVRVLLRIEPPANYNGSTVDRYFEVLTKRHPTDATGRTVRMAIQWPRDDFDGPVCMGRPASYCSMRQSGGTSVTAEIDSGVEPGDWRLLRWTYNAADDLMAVWLPALFPVSDDAEEIDGVWWHMANWSTVTSWDTSTEDWVIGRAATMDIAWLYAEEYGSGTPFIEVTTGDLDALSVGATSFTDSTGNDWTTTDGSIIAAP